MTKRLRFWRDLNLTKNPEILKTFHQVFLFKRKKIVNPPFLEAGDAAEIVFEPKQGLYLESYEDCPGIGRIAVMDSNHLGSNSTNGPLPEPGQTTHPGL